MSNVGGSSPTEEHESVTKKIRMITFLENFTAKGHDHPLEKRFQKFKSADQ